MPANRGLGTPNWNPQPDFPSHHELDPTIDQRVFLINDEHQVKDAVLETDPTFEAYRWCLSDSEIEQLALESAKNIISDRAVLYEFRKKRQERIQREGSQLPLLKAVVGAKVTSIRTGVATTEVYEVERAKSFN